MEWISVEDRLPDDSKFVLVSCLSGYSTISRVCSTARLYKEFRGDRWVDHANDLISDYGLKPTHWMPLPPPPEV